jgi:hypothetical protein
MFGAVAMAPFALYFDAPRPVSHFVPVSGRVTCSGRPLNDATICLDRDGEHSAFGRLQADGSFRIANLSSVTGGALPGRYFVHLYTFSTPQTFPSRYGDPKTSGIELDVVPGWNAFHIDLSAAPGDPTR